MLLCEDVGVNSRPFKYHAPARSDEFDHQIQATSDEDDLFADLACLGLDASADPNNHILLPMPADPSSAEQFTFAFSGLGRDACLALDTPDRGEVLRAMLADRTREIGKLYAASVCAIRRLYEYRCAVCHIRRDRTSGADDCTDFVRRFAHLHNVNIGVELPNFSENDGVPVCNTNPWAVSLSEKSLCSAAVETLRSLLDSPALSGFAEACVVELMAEDVACMTTQAGSDENAEAGDGDTSMRCGITKGTLSRSKAISTLV